MEKLLEKKEGRMKRGERRVSQRGKERKREFYKEEKRERENFTKRKRENKICVSTAGNENI